MNKRKAQLGRQSRTVPGISAAALLGLLLAGCGTENERRPQVAAGAPVEVDRERAELLVRQYGCGSCHVIPGIASAHGLVGPPLSNLADRAYIAGVLPNTHEDLIRWVRNPQAVDPDTAMPDMGLSEEEAGVLAAYLHSL